MSSISPINSLNAHAKQMFYNVVNNKPSQEMHVMNFFREANNSNQQGNALLAYYTEYNKYLNRSDKFIHTTANRIENFPALIEKITKETPSIADEAKTFVNALQKKYPKTLNKRISLAYHGAVSSDKVEPKSKLKKIFVFLNQFMDPLDC